MSVKKDCISSSGRNKTILADTLMMACDVSAICKSWSIQKRIVQFFSVPIMDRDRQHEFPVMQVTFIDTICLPIYQVCQVERQKLLIITDFMYNRSKWKDTQLSENLVGET
uniref:PDEase domain-containing protein n=1 Tax=Tetranychus urticae TaxID=32264 RepID=T1KKU4_TETUR